MTLRALWLAVLGATFLLFADGCSHGAAPLPLPELNEAQRTNGGLPLQGTLTLATETDISNAAIASSAVKGAVERYLSIRGESIRGERAAWQVVAARVVGEYMLLWVGFPEVSDGGIDLIYSSKEQRIVGTFSGGHRG